MSEDWHNVNGENNSVRYVLGPRGEKPLCCVGINPSTAEPDKLDHTLKSVERIAQYNNYNSFIMFNVYPVRSTKFDDLPSDENSAYTENNVVEVVTVIKDLPKPVNIWLAFGDLIDKRPYTRNCFNRLKIAFDQYDYILLCAGLTKSGNPRHPLYLPRETKLQRYLL